MKKIKNFYHFFIEQFRNPLNLFFTCVMLSLFFMLPLVGRVQTESLNFLNLLVLIPSILSFNLLLNLINGATSFSKTLQRSANYFFLYIYVSLAFYHLNTKTGLEFAVISENSGEIFYLESLLLVFSVFAKKNVIYVIFFFFLVGLIDWYLGLMNRWTPHRFPGKSFFFNLFLYFMLIASPLFLYDEVGFFLQTWMRPLNPETLFDVEKKYAELDGKYPHYKVTPVQTKEASDKRNVIVVMVESLNATYINKSDSGVEFTPFLNQLSREWSYFSNFWGNSVQTCKGHFATLCSWPPMIRGKAFIDGYQSNFRCLPEILKENGYQTFFYQAYNQLSFDNTNKFLLKNGVDHVGHVYSKLSADEKLQIWGWGLQDDIFYRHAVDEIYSQKDSRPFFAALASISLHNNFKYVPVSQRFIHKDPQTKLDYYENAIYVTDQYLKVLYEDLLKRNFFTEGGLLLILGDHSFPAGEHDNYYNEVGFFSENFKTPLIIVGNGFEQKIYNKPYSQLDIAPTILDLLKVKAHNSFWGQSIFSEGSGKPIPIIQPYDGISIGVVIDNLKYSYHMRSKTRYLFDLSKDPMETTNLAVDPSYASLTVQLDQYLTDIVIAQKLIKENRVAP